MNTQKAVYNKLFSKKTELETHKVELALADNLEDAVVKLERVRSSAYAFRKDVDTLESNIKPLLKDKREYEQVFKSYKPFLEKAENELQKTFKDVQKKADELGIPVSNLGVVYKRYIAAKKFKKEIENFYEDGNKTLKSLI
jgi:DNA repair ATPase RecN